MNALSYEKNLKPVKKFDSLLENEIAAYRSCVSVIGLNWIFGIFSFRTRHQTS
jgi:hypothetical protein